MSKPMTDSDIKQLYDSFTVKDMSFAQFRKEFKALTDPGRMQRDLDSIMRQRAFGRSRKQQIDAAVSGN